MAVFAYTRVSTSDQNPQNQKLEIQQSGMNVDFWYCDAGVSGSIQASRRPEFQKLLQQIRDGETLIVTKLDRLGRNAIDVGNTINDLQNRRIKVIVLSLGGTDLTSPSGKLLMTMLSAVAEMERDLLIERTQAGLARAKAEGKQLGRKPKTSDGQRVEIRERLESGVSVSQIARDFGISRASVIAIRETSSSSTNKSVLT